jgi:hypothetical protein
MPFFLIFFIFNIILFHPSSKARLLVSSSFLRAQQGKPPRDAEPRIELGSDLQQADALRTELRRTLTLCISFLQGNAPINFRPLIVKGIPLGSWLRFELQTLPAAGR